MKLFGTLIFIFKHAIILIILSYHMNVIWFWFGTFLIELVRRNFHNRRKMSVISTACGQKKRRKVQVTVKINLVKTSRIATQIFPKVNVNVISDTTTTTRDSHRALAKVRAVHHNRHACYFCKQITMTPPKKKSARAIVYAFSPKMLPRYLIKSFCFYNYRNSVLRIKNARSTAPTDNYNLFSQASHLIEY